MIEIIKRDFIGFIAKAANGAPVPLGGYPVPTSLIYDPHDPLLVELRFGGIEAGGDVIWFLSRDLLRKGSVSDVPVGAGDVKLCRPLPSNRIRMCLSAPEGHADVELPYTEVRDFLFAAYRALPAKLEDELIDRAVDAFLAGRPTTEYASDGWDAEIEEEGSE